MTDQMRRTLGAGLPAATRSYLGLRGEPASATADGGAA